MTKIFLTGATGVMGMAGLRHLTQTRYHDGSPHIIVLARDSKINRMKLAPYVEKGIEIIWGDLMDKESVARGVEQADIVLHVGGMVSPMADWYPEKTYRVNTGSMSNIIEAALKKERRGDEIKVVYIGSVSQYGNRPEGVHWGRTGDPVNVAVFDMYALSKSEAERMLAESGLKRWVSLRQTGIMYPRILMKGSDPISFHVPMKGCLEWVTDEESGKILQAVADPALPDEFWNKFYNIGGGEGWRLSNHDFVDLTLRAIGCPPVEKSFRRNWFATRNFHGIWYTDSDKLEDILKFRSQESMKEYLNRIAKDLPWYFRLAPLAPAFLIRMVMKRVASRKVLGPLNWIAENDEERIVAAFGGKDAYEAIPEWQSEADWDLSHTPRKLKHGYDETKPESELCIEDMQEAALFRGGACLSDTMVKGDLNTQLEWECSEGHRFKLSPRTVLKGGHWCPECLKEISNDPHALFRLGNKSRFLGQIISAY